MPKLIPLSKQKMKDMGIVSTKKGLMFQPKEEKKHKSQDKKEIKKEVKPVQKVVIVERKNKSEENERLSNRGIY